MAKKRDPWPDTSKLVCWATPVIYRPIAMVPGGYGPLTFRGTHLRVVDESDSYVVRGKRIYRGWWMFVGAPELREYGSTPGAYQIIYRREMLASADVPTSSYEAITHNPMSFDRGS